MPLLSPPNIEKEKQKGDVRGLLKAIGHRDAYIRLSAENALDELGTAVAGALAVVALSDRNAETRREATERLRKLGTAGVEAIIIDAIQEQRHPIEAVVLLDGLVELLEIEVVEALMTLLEDEDVWVRWWAVSALGEMEDALAVGAVIAALKDDDETVREAAADALGLVGGLEVEQALEEYRAQQE